MRRNKDLYDRILRKVFTASEFELRYQPEFIDGLLFFISSSSYSERDLKLFYIKIKHLLKDEDYISLLEEYDFKRVELYSLIADELCSSMNNSRKIYIERLLFFYERTSLKTIPDKELRKLYFLTTNVRKYSIQKYFSIERLTTLHKKVDRQYQYKLSKIISKKSDQSEDYMSLQKNYEYRIK